MFNLWAITARRDVDVAMYYADFELQRELGDYYVEGGGLPEPSRGRWLGGVAKARGLAGEVSEEAFLHVLDGRDPRTGRRWMRRRKDSLLGIDITASEPKSVSVGGALAYPATSREIQAEQDLAVDTVLGYMVEHVRMIRRGRNGKVVEKARGVLAVGFNHSTSRPTREQKKQGLPADPNGHTHSIVTAAERLDGQLGAIDYRALKFARAELEAVYHCALATGLAQIGLRHRARDERRFRVRDRRGIAGAASRLE